MILPAAARVAVAAAVLACGMAGCVPKVFPPGPPVTAPALQSDGLVMADGVRLPLRVWRSSGRAPTAVVLALHGFNDYSRFFEGAGAFFAEQGLVSYAYDQRGFGAAPDPGLWPGTEALVDDLKDAARLVRARHPDLPLYLLGDSMGGAVVMVAMTGDSAPAVDGIVLAAPAVWGRATMPWYQRAALWLASHTVPWLKVTGRGLKIRASDNIEMLKALGRDPLVIKETRVDALHGITDLMDAALAAAPAFDAPALILYGERDEVVPGDPVFMMLDRLPPAARPRQRIALYSEGWHMLLRDLQAAKVWADVAAWIADPSAALPSGADARARAVLADRTKP